MKHTLTTIIDPALRLLPPMMTSDRAKAMLLAIGMQESRLVHRKQINGPAMGLWQFERGGGVAGVLRHPATQGHAAAVCWRLGNAGTTASVYHGLQSDDVLAACFARLLLWTLPVPLPERDDVVGAWDQYIAAWRPGKPHRHTWDEFYKQAWEVVSGI
jgi:hypothetical protein